MLCAVAGAANSGLAASSFWRGWALPTPSHKRFGPRTKALPRMTVPTSRNLSPSFTLLSFHLRWALPTPGVTMKASQSDNSRIAVTADSPLPAEKSGRLQKTATTLGVCARDLVGVWPPGRRLLASLPPVPWVVVLMVSRFGSGWRARRVWVNRSLIGTTLDWAVRRGRRRASVCHVVVGRGLRVFVPRFRRCVV